MSDNIKWAIETLLKQGRVVDDTMLADARKMASLLDGPTTSNRGWNWTPERDALLRERRAQGFLPSQFLADVNHLPGPMVTLSQLRGRLSFLKLPSVAVGGRPEHGRRLAAQMREKRLTTIRLATSA